MIKNKSKIKNQTTTIVFIIIFLISSFYSMNSTLFNSRNASDTQKSDDIDSIDQITIPEESILKFDSWWNSSFKYRMLINITNPYNQDLKNYGCNITFYYPQLVSQGHLQSDLDDIRIVENNILRKYYFKKDFPTINYATVWFEVNITALATDYDTFMYYGNNTVNIAYNHFIDERFGNAWYRFEEGSGTQAIDSSGTNTGTLGTGVYKPAWVTGEIENYALQFNGNDYVQIPSSSSISPTQDLSISFWVSLAQDSETAIRKNSEDYLFEFGGPQSGTTGKTPQFYVHTYVGTSHSNYFIAGGSSGDYTVTVNKWYHFVVTYDNSYGSKMYINGELAQYWIRTGSTLGNINTANLYLRIGAWGSETFYGKIDDVRLFSQTLSLEEIQWIYSFNKTLIAKINEEQSIFCEISANALDLMGNGIPFANISIYNNSAFYPYFECKTADEEGNAVFSNLRFGTYNFTVEIISNINPNIREIVNRTTNPILLDRISKVINLTCTVSMHIFTVKDVDNNPVESGWIIVGNGTYTPQIQNCSINSNGTAKFWWVNYTSYYYNYTVKYKNAQYNPQEIILKKADITTPFIPINVLTNLTTVNFTVYTGTLENRVPGAKIILRQNSIYGASVVNLTTDDNGKAILRWVNSSDLIAGEIVNYSLQIDFFGLKRFNSSNGGASDTFNKNFTISKEQSIHLKIAVTLENYKTELISANPSDDIDVKWGTELEISCFFNVTNVDDPFIEGHLLGITYADSMNYQIIKGSSIVISGTMPKELNTLGMHRGNIDTSKLVGGENYIIQVSAQKSGYTNPESLNFPLKVSKLELLLNQSQNDDSMIELYWLQYANMSVKPYGEISESFTLEDDIFKSNNHNFKIWIPDLISYWNLSQIEFNIYNITFNTNTNKININITDDFGKKHEFYNNSGNYKFYGVGASNGSWENLVFNLNKESITKNNSFNFLIEGTFSGSIDIVATSSFRRDKILVEMRSFNVSEDISIKSNLQGWAIKNITFILTNCYNPNTWQLVNPEEIIDNITIYGDNAYYFDDAEVGKGNLTIDDRIIYPSNGEFLFNIGNKSNIIFDVCMIIEYIQVFYKHEYLEVNNLTKSMQEIDDGESFQISFDNFYWEDQGIYLLINNLLNQTSGLPINPSDVHMNITIGIETYDIYDFFLGNGYYLLNDFTYFDKNVQYTAYIQTNQPVTFQISYGLNNIRTVVYDVLGSVTYQIREAPDIFGPVNYDAELEYYLIQIDTSSINANTYTVRFTGQKDNYDSSTKDLYIDVKPRLTLLNGNADLVSSLGYSIYVKDAVNFTFTYIDRDLNLNITNLNVKSYTWKQYSTTGVLIDSGAGFLSINEQNQYVLDFNTETKPIGTYTLIVRLEKNNYDVKIATISLTINLRTLDYELGDEFEEKQVSVVKGKKITLTIELIDPTKGNAPLTGATVVLEIGDDELEFDEVEPGVYELEFDTEDYEAFFASNTLTGTIKISKVDYISDEVDITIVVQMEEIFPGIPMFYFIMVVTAIAAVAGALLSYKAIQIARIPKFVKKARAIKKAIKAERDISESLLTNTKEEMISKQFEADWNSVGLSLKVVLGVKEKQVIPEKSGKLLSKIKGGGA